MSQKSGTYVDGFVLAVPSANKDAYRQMAEAAAAVFKEHGALSLVECWGDDVPEGKVNSFHSAVLREPEESVVFAWIVWPSKAVRDAAMKKNMMEDPRMQAWENKIPFDGKRMIFGGFEVIVNA
ncbi:MAG: DUF1428 domain-containing protein [Kiloniellaceae bacterium]